jgi:ABC-2 type transport system ATP-binding protein
MNQIAIRASALARQFSSVRALNDLTIEVPTDMVFGFLGPDGASKTTIIRLLLNLIESTGGSAEVLGF